MSRTLERLPGKDARTGSLVRGARREPVWADLACDVVVAIRYKCNGGLRCAAVPENRRLSAADRTAYYIIGELKIRGSQC